MHLVKEGGYLGISTDVLALMEHGILMGMTKLNHLVFPSVGVLMVIQEELCSWKLPPVIMIQK